MSTAFVSHAAAARRRLEEASARGTVHRAGPDSITWKINREIIVIAGWGRAILLQLAHPLVAAGVAEHSTFRGRPLAPVERLVSTIRTMLSLTFRDDEEAIAAAASINVIHDRVAGRLSSAAGRLAAGTPYSAHEPELLRWVHATLVDSIPLTYELLVGPLTAHERDRYCEEAAMMEPLLGIPDGFLPRRAADLRAYVAGMIDGGEVTVTDTARGLARAVLYPRYSQLLWPVFRPVRLITIGLLPAPLREAYGFRWSVRDERALGRWTVLLRACRRALPPVLREWPVARTAMRRFR